MSGAEIKSVKCARVEKINGKHLYILATTWSDVHFEYVGRTLADFTEFRQSVNLKALINDDSSKTSSITMPDLPLKEKKIFGSTKNDNKKIVDDFFQHFLKLPGSILKNPDVVKFFSHSSAKTEDEVIELFKKGDKPGSVRRQSSSESNTNNNYEEITAERFDAPKDCKVFGNGGYSEIRACDNTSKIDKQPVTADAGVKEDSNIPPTDQLYASIRKPTGKPLVATSLSDISDDQYGDTTNFSSSQGSPTPGESLYAEIGQDQDDVSPVKSVQPPITKPANPVKPAITEITKPPIIKKKMSSSSSDQIPSKNSTPLTPIPPMPLFAPPTLEEADNSDSVSNTSEPGDIQVMALADYKSTTDGVLSFSKGSLATVILQSDSNWWCIRLGSVNGWVPADYWKMLNEGDCAVLSSKSGAPWFVGQLSRPECELSLMMHGKQQDFVVRESDKGHYALSVKYNDHIHHFPIQLTNDKKYNIGKHDFKTVYNVISYYKKNALFYDDKNRSVTLGSPLVILKH